MQGSPGPVSEPTRETPRGGVSEVARDSYLLGDLGEVTLPVTWLHNMSRNSYRWIKRQVSGGRVL